MLAIRWVSNGQKAMIVILMENIVITLVDFMIVYDGKNPLFSRPTKHMLKLNHKDTINYTLSVILSV